MDPLLTASLWALLSAVFFHFVSTAQDITAIAGQNLILPCRDSDNGIIEVVEWTRTDLGSGPVLRFRDEKIDEVHPSFGNRLDLQDKQMKDGDMSLVLKDATIDDTGTYECLTVQRGRNPKEKLLNTINLHVSPPEPFPSWATALLVLVLVLVAAGLLYHFRHCFMSEYYVAVDSGEDCVLLPCRTRPFLPGDARVEWRDRGDRKVHVYENGSDHLEEQNWFYRNRTKMKRNLLRTGDLSLTLEHLTDGDTDIYTCIVSRGKGNILMKKEVHLKVKVTQVEVVDSGEKSVLLPCRATVTLPEDARVVWSGRGHRVVHVYVNGSDHPEEQDQFYRDRTKMNKDLLRTGDLSLTLDHPTDEDTNIYTCIVSRGDENILMKKQVDLKVKVPQVEVDSDKESVLLPCRTTVILTEDVRVEWRDWIDRMVHVYENGSDHPEEQNQFYRTRTKMNEDLLRTRYLSLTLEHPTDRDTMIYTCIVSRGKGNILMKKQVNLKVKVHQVEVDEGAESVLLPFITTTSGLPEGARVEWMDKKDRKVHVYKKGENGSDQPGEQNQLYRNRTKMNEDPLRTGDLSLTLMNPTKEDSGWYICDVRKDRNLLRKKKVNLTVKGIVQDQNQPEDIRTRTSFTEMTPLNPVLSV